MILRIEIIGGLNEKYTGSRGKESFSLYCCVSHHAKTCIKRKMILLQWCNYSVLVLLAALEQAVSAPCQNDRSVMWYYLCCQELISLVLVVSFSSCFCILD